MATYKGIDVSLYQGDPDYHKVKASGIDFVMVKAGQGRLANGSYSAPFTDPQFTKNMTNISYVGNGFYAGSYWYFMANTEEQVREEANYYVSLLKPFRFNHQLWAAVDVEDDYIKSDYNTLSRHVALFCDIVAAAGFRPMVYANSYWLSSKFKSPSGIPIWEANWSATSMPIGSRIWQYSSKGIVPGVSGEVDVNYGIDIIGDANGDGKVDTSDVVLMLKHIANWKNLNIDETQADLNQDGYVTISDVVALLKKIASK